MPTADPLLVEIRTLRDMLGMRADDLAKAAGVDKSSLSYWECGHRSPHLDKIRPVARALGFDLALTPLDPDSESAEALSSYIRGERAEKDRARAERDQLVCVIARLMSLPPETVADAYSVGYTGNPAPEEIDL